MGCLTRCLPAATPQLLRESRFSLSEQAGCSTISEHLPSYLLTVTRLNGSKKLDRLGQKKVCILHGQIKHKEEKKGCIPSGQSKHKAVITVQMPYIITALCLI